MPFGMGPLIARLILPDLIGHHLEEFPNLRSTIIVRGFAELLPLLLDRSIFPWRPRLLRRPSLQRLRPQG